MKRAVLCALCGKILARATICRVNATMYIEATMKQQNYIKRGDKICLLTLDCNDLIYDVCINEKDLLGEPAIGRRFKGVIWMQGKVNY